MLDIDLAGEIKFGQISIAGNDSGDAADGLLQWQRQVQASWWRLAAELMPLIYADVKRLAQHERRCVGAGHTLRTTALIHEAYLKLLRSSSFNDRAHFLRDSALAMRHVLINHVRENMEEKRGGDAIVESLTASHDIGADDDQSLIEIHEALERLALLNVRLAEIVECRFFAGFSEADTALALGISDRTVRRDWIKARAWLRRELAVDGAAPMA